MQAFDVARKNVDPEADTAGRETRATKGVFVVALCLSMTGVGWADDRDKKVEKLDELSARFNRYSTDPLKTPEREFLHERIDELLRRARKTDDDYVFGRLAAAIDDFLDASEEIEDAFDERPDDDDTQERSARELEGTYFDLMQGEHFARQSGDASGEEYVRVGRRLYQTARAAYERGEYAKAYDLAEAASEIVDGLEGLAQAAVRIPTPPKL
jgi:hypothetical protein